MPATGAPTPAPPDLDRVDAMRRFNRFYTRQIGVLHEGLLDSAFSLTQVRVLYEIAHRKGATASDIGRELQIDGGYLSRIIRDFEDDKMVERQPSDADGRQSHLRLTKAGHDAIAVLQQRARDEVGAMLGALSQEDQRRLIAAMEAIERILTRAADTATAPGASRGSGARGARTAAIDSWDAAPASKVPYILRPPQPGDIGWVVHRHGVLYAQEYHWDETFEALVATIAGEFVQNFDPKRERCWIAEREGEIVGCVFLVKSDDPASAEPASATPASAAPTTAAAPATAALAAPTAATPTTAKLRLLLVEPSARGLGIGGRLIEECVRFARRAGYKKITLWTQANLLAARHLYERAGFRLVKAVPNHAFGHDLVSETWDLDLN